MRARLSLVLVLTTLPLNLAAQEESGGGFIGGLLESALSGENRNVTVTGLSGALSSSLTLERLTMSDDQGVWLTISGATLDWTRSALLRGRLDVSTLSAESIVLERLPAASEDEADLPSPEATPFQLPELPVAVSIGEIAVNSFSLGEPVVGIAAELSLAGALTLAEGALDTDISVTRLDRPSDVITLDASFSNETSVIALDFETTEAQGGLLSELLNIPGRPSVSLTAAGEGPLTDFTADIALATDGAPRVTGQVRLRDAAAQG
ncbi:translocation/assembly module TamB, partial [Pseudooceanicola lipolyticus]